MKWVICCAILLMVGSCYSSSSNDLRGDPSFYGDDSVTYKNDRNVCTVNFVRQIRALPKVKNGPSPAKRPRPSRPNLLDPSQSTTPGIRELVNMDGLGRFEVKHMYLDGSYGDEVSSFDKLTGNPEGLRKYLIEVNRRMFKGNVLPATINNKETFEKWVQQAGRNPKKVSLVDAHLSDIQRDIGEQQDFKDYLDRVRNNQQQPNRDNLFKTTEKYLITEIILKMDGDNLNVIIERYKAKLKLGMHNTEVYHYDPFDRSVIDESINGRTVSFVDVESPSSSSRHETTFTREQLLQNAETTLRFWEKLFDVPSVDQVGYKGPINDKAKRFSRVELEYRREWQTIINTPTPPHPQEQVIASVPGACARGGAGRRKRAASKCAFYIDSEGNVESIYPEEFMEIYEGSGAEGRKQMTNLMKNNGEKFIVEDQVHWPEARKQLNQLVHHQEMTTHAGVVETTGTIQDWRRWKKPVPSKASEMVTAIHEAVAGRMNRVRLSSTKIVYNLVKNPHIGKIIEAGRPYGHLMLAKGFINGIIHNDTTALAVIGGRVGYDIVTEGAVDLGSKFFSTASKVGKSARALGKVAGPIGAVVDVGLGVWSLVKSVDRLKEATNKYDRDDAIADIVSDSVDITIGVTTVVLSLAFPPAAPLIMAAGLVISIINSFATSIFHAGNEVERINSEIPLMGFEKEEVFTSRLFDFFGLREKDYIDYLVEEKKANDLEVQAYLAFLKENEQFSGVLFPSRSLAHDGGCHLDHYWCEFGTWLGRPACHSPKIIGNACDWNGPCADTSESCINRQTNFDFYDCVCDAKPETTFGFPHKDSWVDFRSKQKLFWERAVPGDVDGVEFRCKPSSLEYLDFRIQQKESRQEYYCQHAIGLYRPEKERKEGQTFLVNLEDGKDELIADGYADTTAYTFWMGEEGEKNFWGGNTRNEFILNGNCSNGMLKGYLYGGPKETDSLIIAPYCAKGKVIQIENESRMNISIVKLEDRLNLQLHLIENIIGRPEEAESLQVGCPHKQVYLNGGVSTSIPDNITIGPLLHCHLDLQIVLANYTNIESNARKGDVTIYVQEEMSGSTISVFQQPDGVVPKTTVIFTETNSEQIVLEDITLTQDHVSLKIKNYNSEREPLTINFKDRHTRAGMHQFFFNESSKETPNTFSVLMVPGNEKVAKESPLMFYHNLPSHLAPVSQNVRRVGSINIPNIFNVSAGNWDILGGSKDDTFIINIPINNDTIISGGGGEDTLVLASRQDQVIQLNGLGNLNGISTVVKGDQAGPIEISTGFDTGAVVVKGSDPKYPDIVTINACNCSSPTDLQIDAGGATRILVDKQENISGRYRQNNRTIQILAHSIAGQPVMFELDTNGVVVPRMSVQIPLTSSYPPLSVVGEVAESGNDGIVRVKMTGAGLDQAILNFRRGAGTGPFISSPQIQLIPIPPKRGPPSPVQLVLKRGSLEPIAVHIVQEGDDSEARQINGFERIENLYQIFERKRMFDKINGGKVKDTFIGTSTALSCPAYYEGDRESDNTLVVRDDELDSSESKISFEVNLFEGYMVLLDKISKGANVKGAFHNVIGRASQPDVIVAGCATTNIVGKGGHGLDLLDKIVIKDLEKFCQDGKNVQANNSSSLEVHLGPFTTVENSAKMGVFKYFVDLTKTAHHISVSLLPNETALHKVAFITTASNADSQPVVQFESIQFNDSLDVLTFIAKDQSNNNAEMYQFSMHRQDDSSDYSNPTFLITTLGDQGITTDIRVGGDASVIATSLVNTECQNEMEINGLPVHINNIMIDLTVDDDDEEESGNCGKVLGNAGSLENHFWLYAVPAEKEFQIKVPQSSLKDQVNTLHLGENFHGNKSVTVHLSPAHGYLEQYGVKTFVQLQNISSLVGRNSTSSYDAVVPSCSTKQISGVDLVSIILDPSEDCAYELVIGVDPLTRVEFNWLDDDNSEDQRSNLTEFWNSTFHYRFSEPMSFKVVQSYPGMLDGSVHNYYLPFDLDQLEALDFDEEESKLQYTIDGQEYHISMVSQPTENDQFYSQPNMATRDGCRIQVGRDASVLITQVLQGLQIQQPQELLSKFKGIANTLEITIIVKTDTDFMHIGHNGAKSDDRNVLQNLGSFPSYLGGGGAADTIYEVVKLNRNVYIDTGLEDTSPPPAVNMEGPYIEKQTLDLSDIVTPIRLEAGYKYKPSVVQRGDDLVISMMGYENVYPGEIVIYEGAIKEQVRANLQVLLSTAMMEFVSNDGAKTWELSPVELKLERETVYSIAGEELEHGHVVVVLDHKYGPEYYFRFNYSQNGDDLHLSDIEEFRDHRYDKQHIEMTTLIITDFYKRVDEGDAPTEIKNVIIFMPGLKIKLNGTDVLLLSTEENIQEASYSGDNQSFITTAILKLTSEPINKMATSPVVLTTGTMPKWDGVLHRVEESILEQLPFVQRVY